MQKHAAPCSRAPASARATRPLPCAPLRRGLRALTRGGGGGSQVFEETPLGKRREALAEANGWFDGNPAFGRVLTSQEVAARNY